MFYRVLKEKQAIVNFFMSPGLPKPGRLTTSELAVLKCLQFIIRIPAACLPTFNVGNPTCLPTSLEAVSEGLEPSQKELGRQAGLPTKCVILGKRTAYIIIILCRPSRLTTHILCRKSCLPAHIVYILCPQSSLPFLERLLPPVLVGLYLDYIQMPGWVQN